MDLLDEVGPYVAALLPTVGVAFLFYLVIKKIFEADRAERQALARWRREHPTSPGGDSPESPGDSPDDSLRPTR